MKMNKYLSSVLILIMLLVSCFYNLGVVNADTQYNYDMYDPDINDTDLYEPNSNSSGISTLALDSSVETVDKTCEEVTPKSVLSVTADKVYKITGLKSKVNVQKCYYGTNYIFVSQSIGSTVYLSRCAVSGTTATYKDQMILKNFGHNQTLEFYTHNNSTYLWIGCKANSDPAWSVPFTMEVGRIKYQSGVTISDYTKITRLVGLNYANKDGVSFDKIQNDEVYTDVIQRVDAALSSDKTKLILAVRSVHGHIQYSYYNNETLNNLLDKKESQTSKYVTFYSNNTLKNACIFSCVQKSGSRILPNKSCQGIDFTNAYSIYIAGGTGVNYNANENKNYKYVPKIGKMVQNSSGNYTYTTCIKIKNTISGYAPEIEGVQIVGDNLYFMLCTTKSDLKSTTQYVYSIDKNLF
jgi:hypothetical protein